MGAASGWPATTGHAFAFHTTAPPAAVWDALTRGAECGWCFSGLSLRSDWQAGSPLFARVFGSEQPAGVGGTVLHAAPPSRLSYCLQSDPDDPCTYLTWQIRPTTGGCVVKLQVDDLDCPDDEASAEETWLPVLAALQAILAPA